MDGKVELVRRSYILTDTMSEVALTKMSTKGQVVIPKAVRELLLIEEGDVFAVFGANNIIILQRVRLPTQSDLERILAIGSEHAKEKGITREDVEKAIEEYRMERKA